MKLEKMRTEIDVIDSEIIRLINERAKVVKQIGILKAKANLPIVDSEREKKVLQSACAKNQGVLNNQSIIRIYKRILSESQKIQINLKKKINKKGVKTY